jgi:TonB family protein
MTLASECKPALLLIVAIGALAGSGLALGQSQGQSTPPSTGDQHRKEVRISEAESRQRLMRMVPPIYPQTAKQRGIEASVVLDATVSTQGRVVDLRVESGDRIFTPAAIAAVKQWIYDPYPMDHPVEFKTRVTITFTIPKS